jgi:hypothetical protein
MNLIVDQGFHRQFLLNTFDRSATQHLHLQRRLQQYSALDQNIAFVKLGMRPLGLRHAELP